MVIKLKIERYVERPKMAPVKLKIERVLDAPVKVKRTYKKKLLGKDGEGSPVKRVYRKKKINEDRETITVISEDVKETTLIVEPDDNEDIADVVDNTEANTSHLVDLSELPQDAFEINTAPLIEGEVNTPEKMIEEKIESIIANNEKDQSI